MITASVGLVTANCNNGQVGEGAWQQARIGDGTCRWNQCINGGWKTQIVCNTNCATMAGWCV